MNFIKVNNKKYDYTLIDPYQLIEFIRKKSKFILSLEKTIKIYRNEPNFIITNLVMEYINSDADTQTKYSIIHKTNTIISTCRLIYGKNTGYINLVYTNPDYRGLKMCQNHIKHLIDLHKDSIKTYELHVDKDNIPAIKCYENIGFEIIHSVKGDYLMRFHI